MMMSMAGVADVAIMATKLAVQPSKITRHDSKSGGAARTAHEQATQPDQD
jgi:hypothetical protein